MNLLSSRNVDRANIPPSKGAASCRQSGDCGKGAGMKSPLWLDILAWSVAAILTAPLVLPIPWLENRPLFRRGPSKGFRWFIVILFLLLALTGVLLSWSKTREVP
ncbi:MAG TPA: hypothetical protein VGW57_09495 [Chthoniobacterales bacterium]|nr:hypothetical protein [Chthoniobacterales bacterium]